MNKFLSFDLTTEIKCWRKEVDRRSTLKKINYSDGFTIKGSGLSYVGSFIPPIHKGKVIDYSPANLIINFDETNRTVTVLTGITLGDLFNFLACKGLYLPVQPGHPDISIGGCIASCVHGKNQFKDGTFRSYVKELELFHPKYGYIYCDSKTNSDIFELTIGGYGSTGIITKATLFTKLISSNAYKTDVIDIKTIDLIIPTMLKLLKKPNCDYVYGVLDLNRSKTIKSFLLSSTEEAGVMNNFDLSTQIIKKKFFSRSRPIYKCLYTKMTSSLAFIYLFYNSKKTKISLFENLFPAAKNMTYYKLFGSSGFIEKQLIIPLVKFDEFLDCLWQLIKLSKIAIPLCTIKIFKKTPYAGLLRFDFDGVCITIDTEKTDESTKFFKKLDQMALRFSSHTCLYKYSLSSRSLVNQEYGEEFLKFKKKLSLFDSNNIFKSSFTDKIF